MRVQVAARTLGDVVRKLGEKVLPEIIPILEKGLESDRSDQRQVQTTSLHFRPSRFCSCLCARYCVPPKVAKTKIIWCVSCRVCASVCRR